MSNLHSSNDANFNSDVIEQPGLTLVDFWAPWCGPCKMLTPTLEKVKGDLGDSLKIVKVNIDENQSLAGQYRVMNIPLMLLFKDGQQVDSLSGNQPKGKIVDMVERHK